jgi:hypothetical protein
MAILEFHRSITFQLKEEFTMVRIAGIWWIVVSLIHGLGGIIIYSKQWQAIARDGWFNLIAPNPLLCSDIAPSH